MIDLEEINLRGDTTTPRTAAQLKSFRKQSSRRLQQATRLRSLRKFYQASGCEPSLPRLKFLEREDT